MGRNAIGPGEMAEGDGSEAPQRQGRPLRPSQCRTAMRKALSEEFGAIVKGFVEQAKSGSAAHVRLANELLEPPVKKTRRRGEDPVALMLKKLDRD
jgi:hypothetical protein